MSSPPDPAPESPTEEFLRGAAELGIDFDTDDVQRLGAFLALLLDANTRFNLTSITDPAQAWSRHMLDSLSLLPIIATAGATTVIDVGSGGGLPGIPLAITMPNVRFTLLEATGKKARFLEQVAEALKLENVTVVNDRAETAGQDHHRFRERFDVVIARAVGRMPVLLELTVPLARVGGLVVAIKGQQAQAEIEEAAKALRTLHATVVETRRTSTGTIVIIEKQQRTVRLYPRLPGEPARVPL